MHSQGNNFLGNLQRRQCLCKRRQCILITRNFWYILDFYQKMREIINEGLFVCITPTDTVHKKIIVQICAETLGPFYCALASIPTRVRTQAETL